MDTTYPEIGSIWRDSHGFDVTVLAVDKENQKVIYRRPGYEWECACPLIIFRTRFTRIEA